MARVQECDLTFESLENMSDGKIAMLFKRHLATAAGDCANRPNDKAKRKVTLEFSFSPVPDHDDPTICERVDCEIECKARVPVYRSRVIQMRPHNSGFIYNQDFPDSLDQPSLYGDE